MRIVSVQLGKRGAAVVVRMLVGLSTRDETMFGEVRLERHVINFVCSA